MSDGWVANVSDGSTHTETWISGELSPWQRLMQYCKQQNCYVTNLRLTVGKRTVACPPNATGYWQAHGMPGVQGTECDEELHKWRGIGWVENDMVQIMWLARDPQTHHVVGWMDQRTASGQNQIIWTIPQIPVESDIQINTGRVKGIREYSQKIVGTDGD